MSKIKKGLVVFNTPELQSEPGQEPLKCPKCSIVHIMTEKEKKIFEEVLGFETIKERVKKRNQIKLYNLFKDE